jgi:hypothetical protein
MAYFTLLSSQPAGHVVSCRRTPTGICASRKRRTCGQVGIFVECLSPGYCMEVSLMLPATTCPGTLTGTVFAATMRFVRPDLDYGLYLISRELAYEERSLDRFKLPPFANDWDHERGNPRPGPDPPGAGLGTIPSHLPHPPPLENRPFTTINARLPIPFSTP